MQEGDIAVVEYAYVRHPQKDHARAQFYDNPTFLSESEDSGFRYQKHLPISRF